MAPLDTLIPHSFVLADLFDVASMSQEVPDHLLEDEPGLAWVMCPECDGEGWVLAARPNGWTGGDAFAPCPRCRGRREVLETFAAEYSAPTLRRAA